MWGNKKNKHHGRITSLIGQGTEIVGDINFSGGLHVDGRICGNISSSGDEKACITVSENGYIEGEIHIPNIIINGTIEGNVYASNHLELANKARVHGNVYYHIIEMAVGAEVNGNLEHFQEPEKEQAALASEEALVKMSVEETTEELVAERKALKQS